jgi:hypothetical protein
VTRRTARCLITTIAGAALLTCTPASAAPIRECGNYDGARWTFDQIDGAGIFNLTSRVVSCKTARRVALRSHPGDRYRRTWSWGDFTCRILAEAFEYEDVRCKASGGRVVRWQSGA